MSIKSAFFIKNVPMWERALRIGLGAGTAAVGILLGEGLVSGVGVASGLGFALTGVFGFCPLCAMVGRRLPSKS
jgi:hypothetical protein